MINADYLVLMIEMAEMEMEAAEMALDQMVTSDEKSLARVMVAYHRARVQVARKALGLLTAPPEEKIYCICDAPGCGRSVAINGGLLAEHQAYADRPLCIMSGRPVK